MSFDSRNNQMATHFLGLISGLSWRSRWRSMYSILFKKIPRNGTGNCEGLGILVAFLIIGTAEFFSADVAGIGLRTLDVGFYVSSEIVFLCKLFPTFVTHIFLTRFRNPRHVWVKVQLYIYSCFEIWLPCCLCDAYI
jgi:hypothetical protein